MKTLDLKAVRQSRTTAALSMLGAVALSIVVTGCRPNEPSSGHVAGWSLHDPSQRHPIIVSQQPQSMSLRVSRGASGLTPQQRSQVVSFLNRFRGADPSNSRLRIAVPSGAPNDVAAMAAVADMRNLAREHGFDDASLNIEAYHEESDPSPPIRLSFTRFVAQAPECGNWPTNIADDSRNVPYPNFGCATQRNFAVMVANPADLLGPRGMPPRAAERQDQVWDRYVKGESTISKKSTEETVTTK